MLKMQEAKLMLGAREELCYNIGKTLEIIDNKKRSPNLANFQA